ncbi:hypothetical protein B0T21DRAFT_358724 [Apiosordaria backusii]|uniref:Uncharacterized protein n=1 Tax=Apiosordaria backusii TaxID=314023 RepID=A0AA40ET78_9PEZI|nr:hypothetical protein B0T21DRAFT_358724 [Apiosordaria backusii]
MLLFEGFILWTGLEWGFTCCLVPWLFTTAEGSTGKSLLLYHDNEEGNENKSRLSCEACGVLFGGLYLPWIFNALCLLLSSFRPADGLTG